MVPITTTRCEEQREPSINHQFGSPVDHRGFWQLQNTLRSSAAVYAATPEAVFVSMIDKLDAKMGMVQRALRQAGASDEFSERLPGLSSQLLTRKPPPVQEKLPL